MSSRTKLKAAYSNRGPIVYVKRQACFVWNPNVIISLLSPILGFFFPEFMECFPWLVVLFYLMFLGSLPLFWPNLFQDNFSPGLPTQEAAALLEIILCACCCSKQTHSGARYGTTSSCFHYVLLSSMPLWLHEEWHDGLLLLFYLFWEETYGWFFFSPIWEEFSLCLSSSSTIKCYPRSTPKLLY